MDTRVTSNKFVEVRIGPDSAVANVNAPNISELNSLLVVNDDMRWDGFDLNVQASSMEEDPTLSDEAGAQMRSLLQFGGTASFLVPTPDDTGTRKAVRDMVIVPPRV